MRKYIVNLLILSSFLLVGCSTTLPYFIDRSEINTYSMQEKELVRIISKNGARIKVYSLTNSRICIVVPDRMYSTPTVDLDDISNSLILGDQQKKELHDALAEIIDLYNKNYRKGNGTLYDYYIYSNTMDDAVKKILMRIQLRIEDSSSKSDESYCSIVIKILGFIDFISIDEIKLLEEALR